MQTRKKTKSFALALRRRARAAMLLIALLCVHAPHIALPAYGNALDVPHIALPAHGKASDVPHIALPASGKAIDVPHRERYSNSIV